MVGSSAQIQIELHSYSDGWEQKLRNGVWHNSELIETKFCSQISWKWNEMFETLSHLVTIHNCWQEKFQFLFWRFLEQSAFVINHLLCFWPTIHNSVLSFKFSVLTFLRSMSKALKFFFQRSKNNNPARKNICLMLQNLTSSSYILFRETIWTYSIVVKISCSELGKMFLFQQGA